MFKGFKKKSITKAIDSQIKKRAIYSKAIKLKSLAILIDARNDFDFLSVIKLADKLGIKSNQLTIMGLKKSKHKNKGENTNERTFYFNEKNITYSGSLKSNSLVKFVSEPFDVLINFYNEDILSLNLVAAASEAKFKVGFSEVDHRINDLIIGTTPNKIDLFVIELKKYLKILNIV